MDQRHTAVDWCLDVGDIPVLSRDGCLMHFARLATTLLKDEESARDNHVLACSEQTQQ